MLEALILIYLFYLWNYLVEISVMFGRQFGIETHRGGTSGIRFVGFDKLR